MSHSGMTDEDIVSRDHQLILELQQRVERLEQLIPNNEQHLSFSFKILYVFIIPERRERIVETCRLIDSYLCEHPSGKWMLEFDIDGKPAKYRKSQVYHHLSLLLPWLEVTKEWFFQWLSMHTNLTQSVETIKTFFKRSC